MFGDLYHFIGLDWPYRELIFVTSEDVRILGKPRYDKQLKKISFRQTSGEGYADSARF